MTAKDITSDEKRLWETLGGLQKGQKTLETGQKEIKTEVGSIKANCASVSNDFNSRIYDLENAPKQTVKEISVGAGGFKIKGYPLDEVMRKAVWVAILYLVLESVGVIPENAVQKLIKNKQAIIEVANDEARHTGV